MSSISFEIFLEIVYKNQLSDSEKGAKYEEIFKPLMDKLVERCTILVSVIQQRFIAIPPRL